MKKPTNLSLAVANTLAWFDIFGQPVGAEEIHRCLFETKAKLADVERELEKNPRYGVSFGNYFWKRGQTAPLARMARSYRAEKLWTRVRKYRFLFRWTPFLRFVAVGNTLAFGWPSEESDIDLFVVADTRRMFTARLFLTILTHLCGVRRHHDKVAGRFCLSFFTAADALDLSKLALKPSDVSAGARANQRMKNVSAKADPYLAFWTATLIPVWGADSRLVTRANTWIRDYFPNLPWPKLRMAVDPRKSWLRSFAEWLFGGTLGDAFEIVAKRWQLTRARKKYTPKADPTAVIISEKTLKFHERDRRREYADAWKKRCGEIAKQ